jgi:hypothetical protein
MTGVGGTGVAVGTLSVGASGCSPTTAVGVGSAGEAETRAGLPISHAAPRARSPISAVAIANAPSIEMTDSYPLRCAMFPS